MSSLQIYGAIIITIILVFCISNLMAPTDTKVNPPIVDTRYRSKEEAELEWLTKVEKCFKHFNIQERYKLSFKEFVAKIQNGVWEVMVSNGPLDEPGKSNICTAYDDSWRQVSKQ